VARAPGRLDQPAGWSGGAGCARGSATRAARPAGAALRAGARAPSRRGRRPARAIGRAEPTTRSRGSQAAAGTGSLIAGVRALVEPASLPTTYEQSDVDYKDTVNLPKTDFPMKANLPQREPDL
jgi:hypothetical protein